MKGCKIIVKFVDSFISNLAAVQADFAGCRVWALHVIISSPCDLFLGRMSDMKPDMQGNFSLILPLLLCIIIIISLHHNIFVKLVYQLITN